MLLLYQFCYLLKCILNFYSACYLLSDYFHSFTKISVKTTVSRFLKLVSCIDRWITANSALFAAECSNSRAKETETRDVLWARDLAAVAARNPTFPLEEHHRHRQVPRRHQTTNRPQYPLDLSDPCHHPLWIFASILRSRTFDSVIRRLSSFHRRASDSDHIVRNLTIRICRVAGFSGSRNRALSRL